MKFLSDMLQNWERTPITEFAFIPYTELGNSTTIKCPGSMSPYGYFGTEKYLVGGASNEFTYYSYQYGWKEQTICVLQPKDITTASQRHRIIDFPDHKCPLDEYIQCAMDCYPKSIQKCPISAIYIDIVNDKDEEKGDMDEKTEKDEYKFSSRGITYKVTSARQGDLDLDHPIKENKFHQYPLTDLTVNIQDNPTNFCIGMEPGMFYQRDACLESLIDTRYKKVDTYQPPQTLSINHIHTLFSLDEDDEEEDDEKHDDDATNYERMYLKDNFSPKPIFENALKSRRNVALFSRTEIPWGFISQEKEKEQEKEEKKFIAIERNIEKNAINRLLSHKSFLNISDIKMNLIDATTSTSAIDATTSTTTTPTCTSTITSITPSLLNINETMSNTNKYLLTITFFYILFSFLWLFMSAGSESEENSVEWGCSVMGYKWGVGMFGFFIFDICTLYIIINFAVHSIPWYIDLSNSIPCLDDDTVVIFKQYISFVKLAILSWILLSLYCFIALLCNIVSMRIIRYLLCCICEEEKKDDLYYYPPYGTPEYFKRYSNILNNVSQHGEAVVDDGTITAPILPMATRNNHNNDNSHNSDNSNNRPINTDYRDLSNEGLLDNLESDIPDVYADTVYSVNN